MTIIDFLEKQHWIFAKTYAKTSPHEYCLKNDVVGTKREFEEACRVILEEGFPACFFTYPNKYIYGNGHMYWVMHDVAKECILINRSDVNDYDMFIYPGFLKLIYLMFPPLKALKKKRLQFRYLKKSVWSYIRSLRQNRKKILNHRTCYLLRITNVCVKSAVMLCSLRKERYNDFIKDI